MRLFFQVLLVLMIPMFFFNSCDTTVESPEYEIAVAPEKQKVEEAIAMATNYLKDVTDDDGKFVYIKYVNPIAFYKKQYNLLRHCGAVYSMVQSYNRHADDTLKYAILKGATYLKDKFLDTVPDNPGLLALWSDPSISISSGSLMAKLGGTGLGLVALSDIERIQPGFTSTEQLRSLGEFILFMQNENGSFVSNYVPGEGGKDWNWVSLYYPGEACLGLIKLYKIDPDPRWVNSAIKCLEYLSESRKNAEDIPIDHWALIATSELFNLPNHESFEMSKDLIIEHATRISKKILQQQLTNDPEQKKIGAFTPNWETTPTSTRLEGLTSMLTMLPDTSTLYSEIFAASDLGINYLLHAQIKSGDGKGAFTRNIRTYKDEEEERKDSWGNSEIRIDYVQHALSALIQYLNIIDPV